MPDHSVRISLELLICETASTTDQVENRITDALNEFSEGYEIMSLFVQQSTACTPESDE